METPIWELYKVSLEAYVPAFHKALGAAWERTIADKVYLVGSAGGERQVSRMARIGAQEVDNAVKCRECRQ
jgi:hypothetical protein